MTDATTDEAEAAPRKKKGLKGPLLIGLLLALLGGGGGAAAVMLGLLGGDSHGGEAGPSTEEEAAPLTPMEEVAFVALEPMVVNLPPGSARDFLSFRATLEVHPDAVADVEAVVPRVVDVLNTYLRTLDPAALEDPTFLPRTRGQLLRRVQIVAGEDRVRDILIIEFVLN
ncbi:flagellar basal body-associated FliL family protein [Wenxinia saemankumensis]|uniref:Flagellar protein FliL n=1 Tax=Wenxinia saemankumensis TaxID=1447782 RepID=A0A1M6G6Q7_9RHOB|nr:flagellar basal body-associated FliL family protein [Wenxinia saemankumensis]SHJ05661.1 flagellar FliL protein [Wenxinia saemankumensis]